MPLIDTHCHLDFDVFDAGRTSLVRRCRKKGLTGFIVPGVAQSGWHKLMAIGGEFDDVHIAPGLHPCFTDEHQLSHLDDLRTMLKTPHHKIIAIGEIGLDYFIASADREQQQEFFRQQVKIAAEFRLPLLLHIRKAHDQVLQVIRRKKFSFGGIVHCYSGSLQQAGYYLDAGFKLGIGGVITYDNAHRLQTIARSLPLSAFVLETDAPDIPLAGLQGQVNTPETLPDVCRAFSKYRDESQETVMEALYRNTLDLFPQLRT